MRVPALLRPAPEGSPTGASADPVARARRRWVVGLTLVVGVALLAGTLAVPADSPAFLALGFALAAVWLAGGIVSGPIRVGCPAGTAGVGASVPAGADGGVTGLQAVLGPVVLGVAAYAVFLLLYLALRDVPVLDGALEGILDRADAAALGLVLALALANAVAEEVFFRGALVEAVGGSRAPVVATAVYVLTTVAGRNVALVAAAAVMGTVFMLERLATRGVLAPILTHVTWSTLMVLALPR